MREGRLGYNCENGRYGLLSMEYRKCVTVRDGCDGIFDSGGGIKITVTTVTYRHILSRRGWIRWEMCKYHRNYLCSCSAFT